MSRMTYIEACKIETHYDAGQYQGLAIMLAIDHPLTPKEAQLCIDAAQDLKEKLRREAVLNDPRSMSMVIKLVEYVATA